MRKIVVGYDGSDCGRAALEEACRLSKEMGDEIVVVFGYAPGGYGGGEIPTHREAVEEIGEKVAKEAQERALAAGVKSEVKLMPLKPDHALVQAADDVDARMIIVGSYGEAPLKGAILGSTPYRLLHISERPVLVVPASK